MKNQLATQEKQALIDRVANLENIVAGFINTTLKRTRTGEAGTVELWAAQTAGKKLMFDAMMEAYPRFAIAVSNLMAAVKGIGYLAHAANQPETRATLKSAIGDVSKYVKELESTLKEITAQYDFFVVNQDLLSEVLTDCKALQKQADKYLASGGGFAQETLRAYIRQSEPSYNAIFGGVIYKRPGIKPDSIQDRLCAKFNAYLMSNEGDPDYHFINAFNDVYADLEADHNADELDEEWEQIDTWKRGSKEDSAQRRLSHWRRRQT